MKNILITGCSSGLGLETARYLVDEGHRVYATARTPNKSVELQAFKQQYTNLHILPMDVCDEKSVSECIGQILQQRPIDVLINNAGIAGCGSVEEMNMSVFQQIMDTNLYGAIRCIQAVLPAMRKRQKGCIINMSSISGRIFGSFMSGYCASKAALEALSESLAQEVAPLGIRVAVVQPEIFNTSIFPKMRVEDIISDYPTLKLKPAVWSRQLQTAPPLMVVAEVINSIINGANHAFRHPAGPNAQQLLNMRNSIADEDWIAVGNKVIK